MLYKTWTAGLKEMTKWKSKKVKKEITYVYVANRDRDCDLLHDRPVREEAPRQNRNCLLSYSQNLVMSPRGARCQDGLIDCQLQS